MRIANGSCEKSFKIMNNNDSKARIKAEEKISGRFLNMVWKKLIVMILYEQHQGLQQGDLRTRNLNKISSKDKKLFETISRSLMNVEGVAARKVLSMQSAEMKPAMSVLTTTIFGMTTLALLRMRRSRGIFFFWNKQQAKNIHIKTNMHSFHHRVYNSPFTRETTATRHSSRTTNRKGSKSLPSFVPDTVTPLERLLNHKSTTTGHISNGATKQNQGTFRYLIGWTVDFMMGFGAMTIFFWNQFDAGKCLLNSYKSH